MPNREPTKPRFDHTTPQLTAVDLDWLVPPWARPHCSLDPVKMCTSWTCLVDRCAEPDKAYEAIRSAQKAGSVEKADAWQRDHNDWGDKG